MSSSDFFRSFAEDVVEHALSAIEEDMHGKASSVVDPLTGKHAPVFIRRNGKDGMTIYVSGSAEFARALEQRLQLNSEEVIQMTNPSKQERNVYLAHATEDKSIARPLAESLMQKGINVWYDNWEIGFGDSLRRKMEDGLGECTHFVVLLTETSIKKPWVNEEIDVGLMKAVEGSAKFIGLRYQLPLTEVSQFLRTRLTPEFVLSDASVKELADQIYGVSRKPPLGDKPKYVQEHEIGSSWSGAAKAVAEFFVRNTEHAAKYDPQASYDDIMQETGLSMADVRVGVLDLVGSGLVERSNTIGSDIVYPTADLFTIFDGFFMKWNPEQDARDLAVRLLNLDESQLDSQEVAESLGWPARRFNPAAAYLISAKIVKSIEYMGGSHYWPPAMRCGDELLRFVRSL